MGCGLARRPDQGDSGRRTWHALGQLPTDSGGSGIHFDRSLHRGPPLRDYRQLNDGRSGQLLVASAQEITHSSAEAVERRGRRRGSGRRRHGSVRPWHRRRSEGFRSTLPR